MGSYNCSERIARRPASTITAEASHFILSIDLSTVIYSFIAPWRIFCLTILSGIIRIVLFDCLGCSLQEVAPLWAFEVLLFLKVDKTGYLKSTEIINTDSSLFLESGACLHSSSCPYAGPTPQGPVGFDQFHSLWGLEHKHTFRVCSPTAILFKLKDAGISDGWMLTNSSGCCR